MGRTQGLGHRAAVGGQLHVDQAYGALVALRRLVHQREDAGGAGQGHHDHVELLGDLADRVGERAGERQQRDQRADGQVARAGQAEVAHAGQRHRAADHGQQDVQQVAHVVDHRHRDVAVDVGLGAGMEQLLVLGVERGGGGRLVVEDLDDLLAVDCLLHEGVDIAQGLLLLEEVAAGAADEHAHHHDQHHGEREHEQRDRHGQPQHGDQRRERGDGGLEHLRERLADRLAQRVGVVGVAAHDVAVLVRVEVLDRQQLLVGEHLVADLLEHALLHVHQQPLVEPRTEGADRIQAAHQRQHVDQRGPVGVVEPDQGQDVVVDQRLQEQRGAGLRRRGYQDAEHHDSHLDLEFQDVAEQSLDGARSRLGAPEHRAAVAEFFVSHALHVLLAGVLLGCGGSGLCHHCSPALFWVCDS